MKKTQEKIIELAERISVAYDYVGANSYLYVNDEKGHVYKNEPFGDYINIGFQSTTSEVKLSFRGDGWIVGIQLPVNKRTLTKFLQDLELAFLPWLDDLESSKKKVFEKKLEDVKDAQAELKIKQEIVLKSQYKGA